MTSPLKAIARWFAPAASVPVESQRADRARAIPEITANLRSAVTRLRTSEQSSEKAVFQAFSRFADKQ